MDPISASVGAIGLGMKLYGMFSAASDTKKAFGIEQNISGLEGQVNDQRRNAMELSAKRQQLEIFRNSQRLRAQGMQSAVNQGAQYGSGLQGSLAQNTDQGLFNAQGVNQNLEIGRNIFGLNDKISQQKLALSGVKGDIATDQGWASLGGAMMSSAGTIGNVSGAVSGGISSYSSLMSGGSLSGGQGKT